MPTHERKQLRDAVIAKLVAANTSASTRVTNSRLAPADDDTLPCISVYTDDEFTDPKSKESDPRKLVRKPIVAIEAWVAVAAGGAIDDAVDAIALEIETAMDADTEFGGKTGDSVLSKTEIGMKLDGRRPMGCVRLEYDAQYITPRRVTDPTDLFDEVAATTSLQNTQAEADQSGQLITGINQE